jgi:hypothetical protein
MSLSQPQRRSIVLVVGRPRAAFSHSGRLGSLPCLAYHSRTASMVCSYSAGRTAVASLTVGGGQGMDSRSLAHVWPSTITGGWTPTPGR